jgi:hypothetical protein
VHRVESMTAPRTRRTIGILVVLVVGLLWLVVARNQGQQDRGESAGTRTAVTNGDAPLARGGTRSTANTARQVAPEVTPGSGMTGTGGAGSNQATFSGFVFDAQGLPVDGAQVELAADGAPVAVTDAQGAFECQSAKQALALVAHQGGRRSAVGIATQERPVELRLLERGALVVQVMSGNNKPIEGAEVSFARDGDANVVQRTSANGQARFSVESGGRHAITAAADGFGTRAVVLGLDATTPEEQHVVITLTTGFRVSGTVVDAAGQPAAGAEVWAVNVTTSERLMSGAARPVRAEPNGTFTLAGLPRGIYRLKAFHSERGSAESAPILVQAAGASVRLKLEPDPALRGKVVDAQGGPVAAAEVRLIPRSAGHFRVLEVLHAVTTSDGTFTLKLPRAETSQVLARHQGRVSNTVNIPTGNAPDFVTLVVNDGASVRGRVVTPEGRGLSGLLVRAMSAQTGLEGAHEARLVGELSAPTQANGSFILEGMQSGSYWVQVFESRTAPGLLESAVRVEAGAQGVQLVVSGCGRVEGWLEREDGSVVEQASVSIDGKPLVPLSRGGIFTLEPLKAGNHRLVFSGPGFEPTLTEGVEVVADETTDLRAIRVKSGKALQGTVTDAEGRAVGGALVVLAPSIIGDGATVAAESTRNDPLFKETYSDAQGAFTLSGIASETLTLVAEHPDFGRSTPALVAANDPGPLTIKLLAGSAISGRVTVHSSGVEGIAVTLSSTDASDSKGARARFAVTSGPGGDFNLFDVPPGTYQGAAVNLREDGVYEWVSQTVRVQAGERRELTFDLTPGTAQVALRSRGGTAVSGQLLSPRTYVSSHPELPIAAVQPGSYKACITLQRAAADPAHGAADAAEQRCANVSVSGGGPLQTFEL